LKDLKAIPTKGRLIAEEIQEKKTTTGIILTPSANPTSKAYKVLKVGKDMEEFENTTIFVHSRSGTVVEIDGFEYTIFGESEILAFEK